MDSKSKDTPLPTANKYLRFNAIDYLKQETDLIAKNSEDYDSRSELNKVAQYSREWPSWLNSPPINSICSTRSQCATTLSTADQSSTSSAAVDRPSNKNDDLVERFVKLNFSKSTTNGEKENESDDGDLKNYSNDVENDSLSSDDDEDSDDQLTSNCALHNLEESCSSGCTSTSQGDEDNSSIDWDDDGSSSDEEDDDEVSTASSSSGEGGKVWRKNWTMSTILGNPVWLDKFKVKRFDNMEQFELFKHECELALQEVLCRYAYNTIGSFNQFYEDYKAIDKDANFDFDEFYFNYKAKLKSDSLSCVGLSIRLLELFRKRFGDSIIDHCGTVSCEEIVKNPNKYNMHMPNTAKEHCLSALKFSITDFDKKRMGYLVFDPGYHVHRAVVVMQDASCYPHTGRFTVSEQPHLKREYSYNLIADRYVTWTTKETKRAKVGDRNVVKEINNLIYVKQGFGNPIDIAEKRSFIFSFKSFVIRNRKGCLAGLYGNLKNNSITIFYPERSSEEYSGVEPIRKNVKFTESEINNDSMKCELKVLAKYMVETGMQLDWPTNDDCERVEYAFNYLLNMLSAYREAVKDRRFVNQFVEIDLWIEEDLWDLKK